MNDPENKWDELFDQLPVDSAARLEHQQQLKNQVLDAFDNCPPRPHSKLKRAGHIIMKFKLPQLTIAAAVVAAIATVFQFGATPAHALETLVNRIVNAKSARWVSVVDVGEFGRQTIRTTVVPGRTRQEKQDGSVMIFDWKAGKALSLTPQSKTAIQMKLGEDTKEFDGGNIFESLRSTLQDEIKSGAIRNAKPSKSKTVDGRKLIGFEIDNDLTIWAEDGGDVPVEIEFTMPKGMKIVMQKYESDFAVAPSLFSVDIPAGYTTSQVDLPTGLPTEASFIDTLRLSCKANSDGTFPPGLDIASTSKATVDIHMYLLKEMKGAGKQKATGEQISEMTKKVMGFSFVTMLSVSGDADAHYAGQNVKPGTKDRPIFWYKPRGEKQYRVIFADLTVREQPVAPTVDGAVKLSR